VEGRGLGSRSTSEVTTAWRLAMSLAPPATVGKLQAALHAKAKRAPTCRFYALYDKLYRPDVLAFAYARCRANGGAPGVDDQTFADIEAYGREKWLGELAEELHQKTYHPQPVRRVWIPKPDGKRRPLGIPMIRSYYVSSQGGWGFGPTGHAREAVKDANGHRQTARGAGNRHPCAQSSGPQLIAAASG
jgi:RNA-directed DNA polymerase